MKSSADKEKSKLIIYAPGIHTGGGYTLLRGLLASNKLRDIPSTLVLDARSQANALKPERAEIHTIHASPLARLKAELHLKQIVRPGDTLICLHSLPPLFRLQGRTICFHQNILLLGGLSLKGYSLKTQLRLKIERLFGKFLRSRVDTYAVQTQSMKRALQAWHRRDPKIVICPFVPDITPSAGSTNRKPEIDFVYIADGLPHKNHLNLLEAWKLMAHKGVKPSLCMTLTTRDSDLIAQIESLSREYGLNIENRSHLTTEEIADLYDSSRALIYPSLAESFGLPLIEAQRHGIPIIASELDFVRDVCQPAETFDPSSPLSIARAVHRFLSLPEEHQAVYSADLFFQTILMQDRRESAGKIQ
ncbi:MAG: glycosyltransferase [Candidatus Thiodiazotropha sp. (ex Monitilora ramsayi)]|nr:glycosyltransferase [Candidatus Thiodiazotropha sp. (ex Monitilora ramsayi)]